VDRKLNVASRIGVAVCLLFALTISYFFTKSSIVHISNPYQFIGHIDSYRILPGFATQVAALFLPILQLTLAIGLMFGNIRFYSVFSVILLVVFFIAQLSTVARGIDLSCGCFSSGNENLIGIRTMIIPLGLAIGLGIPTFLQWRYFDRPFGKCFSALVDCS